LHTHTRGYTCTHTRGHTCVHTYMGLHLCTHTHTHGVTLAHTHTHGVTLVDTHTHTRGHTCGKTWPGVASHCGTTTEGRCFLCSGADSPIRRLQRKTTPGQVLKGCFEGLSDKRHFCLMSTGCDQLPSVSRVSTVYRKEKRQGRGSYSLFLLSFIGITFISLQKNSAHTLEHRPLDKGKCSIKQARMQGRS
jgi:hypothetical protein